MPAVPAGPQLGSRYCDITTTARFSGTVTLCINCGDLCGSGQSNPDLAFQFTTVGGEPGYRFNPKTTGFAGGACQRRFTVDAGGPGLAVSIQVR